MTPRTWSIETVSAGNSTSHHVAPASRKGSGSVPTGSAAAMSKGSVVTPTASPRSTARSSTSSAGWSGCSRSTGMNPWWRAARRTGRGFPYDPATHTVTPEPHAEGESAAAEPVEGRCLPRHLGRPTSGKWGDHRAQSDALGRDRDRCKRDPRVGDVHHGLGPAKLVPDEYAVPPASSASEARLATTRGSASSSKRGTKSAERIPGTLRHQSTSG
jgi:hypothetical protein